DQRFAARAEQLDAAVVREPGLAIVGLDADEGEIQLLAGEEELVRSDLELLRDGGIAVVVAKLDRGVGRVLLRVDHVVVGEDELTAHDGAGPEAALLHACRHEDAPDALRGGDAEIEKAARQQVVVDDDGLEELLAGVWILTELDGKVFQVEQSGP